MAKNHTVIYLPGLSDPHPIEKSILSLWKFYRIEVIYLPLIWSDSRPFNDKLMEITNLVDKLHKSGTTISIIGASAGASAAINAYAKKKEIVSKLICICGKINNPNTISNVTFKNNPSFKESLDLLPNSLLQISKLDRKKILSLHPLRDFVVPIKDTYIEDASNKTLISFGHSFSIFFAITIGSYLSARFIKK